MITYNVREDGIFFVKFIGPVTFQDVREYLEKFGKITNLPKDIKLLYDFQEGEIDFIEEDLINIAKLADKATENYNSVRTAFLTSQPDTTAFSFLFSQLKQKPNNKRHVFSTYEAAMNWLKD
jgi:hypothetical protein